MDTKKCSKCALVKPVDEFGKARNTKTGLASRCKVCDRKSKAESNARVKERMGSAWRDRQAGYTAKYRERHPDRVAEYERRHNLEYKFGLKIPEYEALLADQGGVCAACGSSPESKRLAVDHDRTCCPGTRSCGRCVRGLLCSNCNTALGLVKDDPYRLVRYLEGR